MRDDNLEVGVTLRGWIHWFISKDDCRARRYDFPRLGQKLGRQPTFLRRQEEAFIRAVLCRSRYLHPAKMSVCIRPLESAENTIVQRRNDVGIRNPRPADLHTITVDINGFVPAADNQRRPGCTVSAGAECVSAMITVAPFIVTPKSSLENSNGKRTHPCESG